ncbi:MAG: phosphotransferase [Streptosporangiales bacterium]|nr:phosphotransferase [Streptosporangiales bacterium]
MSVEVELRELCTRYRAEPIRMLPARYGFVVAVAATDARLVMKASADPWGAYQAEVAIALAALGVGPTVHEHVVTETGTWTVMEHVLPGSPLEKVEASTVEALATMFHSMASQSAPTTELPMLNDWLRDRLVGHDVSDLAPGRQQAPLTERQRALAMLGDLGDCHDGLCHGDTSPQNVLLGPDGRMFFIDPRGVRGEVSYDAAVLALKVAPYAEPRTIAIQLAKRAGLPAERVEAWTVVADAARV